MYVERESLGDIHEENKQFRVHLSDAEHRKKTAREKEKERKGKMSSRSYHTNGTTGSRGTSLFRSPSARQ